MKVIIIGSSHNNTAEYYKKLGVAPSNLIISNNDLLTIGHTSVQDIPDLVKLEIILKSADQVYWAECKKEEFYNDNEYYNFLNWLKDFNLKYRTVQNIDQIKFDVYDWGTQIPVNQNQIVFLGCSFTAGTGLSDKNTHYSSIVAKYFNRDLLNLAQGGGSNSLIFDRFSRLQLNQGQLVVIQLTGLYRLHYCTTSKQLSQVVLSTTPIEKNLHRSMLEVYHTDFLFYELLCKIRVIIKIAQAQKLKLVFWLVDYKDEDTYSKLQQTYFYDMLEFMPASWIENYYIDTAEDDLHPGIKSNCNIANALIKYIETIYEI